ncbi:MAG: serine protease [Spirirestis rafaelensis WJT71-NPBG6]|jgi:tetratricopeptide (TPR) repeat protein|nr:serine protease [Spirirestis rafaelensis WJT71-NPBG6]
MRFCEGLPAVLIGASAIVIVQPYIAVAITPNQINEIAKGITVLIDGQYPGSGVIIARKGNTYYVLTATHVVATEDKYEVVTPDGKRYAVNYGTVKKLPGVDMAVLQFTSNQDYPVAKIGNSDQATEGETIYVAGFPQPTAAINHSIYVFTDGRITANASRPLADGYALVYSNNSLPGMSGGSVLNEKGEIIGIHGRADTTKTQASDINPEIVVKTNFNLGIPINTFLRLSSSAGVDVGVRPPIQQIATAPKADDFFIQGGDKYSKGDFQGAIAAYTVAIRINPNYANVYNNRGNARSKLGDNQGAIADYNQAIQLNPNSADAYHNRGIAHSDLGDKQGAIADYNQAIRLNPNYANAYTNRGVARSELGDKQGAIADYNQAIRLNPNYANAYTNRGVARSELGDKQGAIADYNQAIRLNPNYANAYTNRGVARSELGDNQGAIADHNQAIRLNPSFFSAYYNRGNARDDLVDKQGAITDYNQAIQLNPSFANAYYNRGLIRSDLRDKQGAIADCQRAAELFQQQGNTQLYQKALDNIRQLQQ